MKTMMEEPQSELVVLIEKSPLELTTKEALKEQFSDYAAQVAVWKSNAANLLVTDVSQKSLIKECKTARLAVKDIRVEIEKTRKRLKADSLERGKAIDNIAKYLSNEIEPLEAYLQEQEDFEKNMIAKRMEELKQLRWSKLREIDGVDPSMYNVEAMSEQVFSDLLNSLCTQADERIRQEAIRVENERLEHERIAAEQVAKDEEYARIRKENQEKDWLMKEERAKFAQQQKEKDEAIAAEQKKTRDAEIKAEQEKVKADNLKKTVAKQKEEIKANVFDNEKLEEQMKKIVESKGSFITETDPRELLELFLSEVNLTMDHLDELVPKWKTWVKTKFRKL